MDGSIINNIVCQKSKKSIHENQISDAEVTIADLKRHLGPSFQLFMNEQTEQAGCYAVHSQNAWETKCGDVPAPAARFAIPTPDEALNQNDKSYLCSLTDLSEAQCANVQFSLQGSGISAEEGVIQYGVDVRMTLNEKQCAATVWKTQQSDHTWVLSSPTSILGSPDECDLP